MNLFKLKSASEQRPVKRSVPLHIRIGAVVAATTFSWTFVAAPPAMALVEAQRISKADALAHPKPLTAAQLAQRIAKAQADAQHRLDIKFKGHRKPGLPGLAQFAKVHDAKHPSKQVGIYKTQFSNPGSLLSDVATLLRPTRPAELTAWRSELKEAKLPKERAAQLHIWLGEYALAHDEQPGIAISQFQIAQKLTPKSNSLHGLAAYDQAVSIYNQGAYAEAAVAFARLSNFKHSMPGYDLKQCALWERHASACAGYHAQHSAIGIPEPTRLDPLCAAAAIAARTRVLGMAWDAKTILKALRVTGEGSNLADIEAAGPKLGLHIVPVNATEQGLQELPKPLVAHVEHDHFVAVTSATKSGVSYLCSDCGPWPGGAVHLTWKQWRTMNPGVYAVIVKPGSADDQRLLASSPGPQPVKVAMAGTMEQAVRTAINFHVSALPFHGVQIRMFAGRYTECDSKMHSARCPKILTCCPFDCPDKKPVKGPGPVKLAHGASEGDPVNLATGEEEYEPNADISVYNPHGPSVTWGRNYVSLSSTEMGDADFGAGWSQSYNLGISYNNVVFEDGSKVPFNVVGSPTVSQPVVHCQLPPGSPFLVDYDYNVNTGRLYYAVTFSDRTQWIFDNGGSFARISQEIDRNGNAIDFKYGSAGLSTIRDHSNNQPLLTIVRESAGNISEVYDCYGRAIYYHVSGYQIHSDAQYELDFVSQIVPTCTANPPARYVYSYQGTTSPSQSGGFIEFLHQITVPSPTGNGTSTSTINYDLNREAVTSLVDANGNTRTYTSAALFGGPYGNVSANGTNATSVTVTNSQGTGVYGYTAAFDNNMSGTTVTDGAGQLTSQNIYSDPNDPYDPSMVIDGNASATHADVVTPAGQTTSVIPTTTGTPSTSSWDITNPAGTVIATDVNPNGWNATIGSSGNSIALSVPSGASYNDGYLVRITKAGSAAESAKFDVTSPYATYGTSTYTWDSVGNCVGVVSPSGTPTSYVYDYSNFALGELVQTKVGTQQPSSATYYEPSGYVKSTLSPMPGTVGGTAAVQSSWTYNQYGNVTSMTSPGNPTSPNITTTFGYSSDGTYSQEVRNGQPLYATNSLGQTVHYRYDQLCNIISFVDNAGHETDETYNINGDGLVITAPPTGQTGAGRSTAVTSYLYPAGPVTAVNDYNEDGSLCSAENAYYGPEGELLATSGSSLPAQYTYDAMYRCVVFKDANGNATTTTIGSSGQISSITYPDGTSCSYPTYNGDGDVTQKIDARGVVTNYFYSNVWGALSSIQYPSNPQLNEYMTYDRYGRLAGYSDGSTASPSGPGQTATYDDNGSLSSLSTTYVGPTTGTYLPTQTLSYTKNADGSRSSMTTAVGTFTYGYDALGRNVSVTNPYGELTSWTYNSANLLNSTTNNLGLVSTSTYNAANNRIKLQNTDRNGSILSSYTVTGQNPLGMRTSETAAMPGLPATYSGNTGYTYDSKFQLVQENSTRAGGFVNQNSYDGRGNITQLRSHALPGTYSTTNATIGTGYQYDNNGNPIQYAGTSLSFDVKNRLVSVGNNISYGYTREQRAWKQTSAGRTYYMYDNGDLLYETDSTGAVTVANTYNPNGLVSSHSSIGTTYYTYDLSHNNSERFDQAGNLLGAYIVDGYGNRTGTNTASDPHSGMGAEVGYYCDGETGFILLGARYYDPAIGRFINRDPIGLAGGQNQYSYAANNPIDNTDPGGHLSLGTGIPGTTEAPVAGPPEAAPPGFPVEPVAGGGAIIVIWGGVEAGQELSDYRICHPTGPFTSIGETIGKWVGAPCPTEDDPDEFGPNPIICATKKRPSRPSKSENSTELSTCFTDWHYIKDCDNGKMPASRGEARRKWCKCVLDKVHGDDKWQRDSKAQKAFSECTKYHRITGK